MTAETPTVLFVCPVAEVGGAEQVTLAIARALPAAGLRPVLAVMRPGPLTGIARENGIETHEFAKSHRYRDVVTVARGVGWLVRLARTSRATLVHSTHTAHLYASPAAKMLRLPEVWHLHDTPSPRPDVIERVQRLLPTSHAIFTTRAVAAAYPRLTINSHSIIAPVCVDPNALAARPDVSDVRTRLKIPDGPLLLTVTRLQEHKGHADLLDAAAIVVRSHPTATFAVVGKASTPEQAAHSDRLRAQADRLGLGGRVTFTGFVSDGDLAALYRRAAAMVHPARTEGYGLVLLEAMGMGVPVVAAAAAGPAGIVRDGDNGLLVPVGDPPALAAAAGRLLSDPALATRLAAGGRVTADASGVAGMAAATVCVFRRLTDRPADRA